MLIESDLIVYIVYPVQIFGWEDFASFDVML